MACAHLLRVLQQVAEGDAAVRTHLAAGQTVRLNFLDDERTRNIQKIRGLDGRELLVFGQEHHRAPLA